MLGRQVCLTDRMRQIILQGVKLFDQHPVSMIMPCLIVLYSGSQDFSIVWMILLISSTLFPFFSTMIF